MNLSLTKKILLSVISLGVVGSLVGMGTFASFTAVQTNPGNTFSTGTLTLDTLKGATGATNVNGVSFITLSTMKPGDSKTEFLDVKASGTLNIASYTLTTSATTSSLLNTDANGLTLTIKQCTVPWTGTVTAPVCGGTMTTPKNGVAVSQAAFAIGSTPLAASTSDHYLITIALPNAVANQNNLQGLSSTIQFQWDGTQQAGTAS